MIFIFELGPTAAYVAMVGIVAAFIIAAVYVVISWRMNRAAMSRGGN
jgi:hypothetical protein